VPQRARLYTFVPVSVRQRRSWRNRASRTQSQISRRLALMNAFVHSGIAET
jgi:hypothetical protein